MKRSVEKAVSDLVPKDHMVPSVVPGAFRSRRKTSHVKKVSVVSPVECAIHLYCHDGSYIHEAFEPSLPGCALAVSQQGSRETRWQLEVGLSNAHLL